MNLDYAIERLAQSGWSPDGEMELECLPDGRRFPGVATVQTEFARAGLQLSIKHNPGFNCYRASWAPAGKAAGGASGDERHGTVIGACEREAAVYALAQLRSSRMQQAMATA